MGARSWTQRSEAQNHACGIDSKRMTEVILWKLCQVRIIKTGSGQNHEEVQYFYMVLKSHPSKLHNLYAIIKDRFKSTDSGVRLTGFQCQFHYSLAWASQVSSLNLSFAICQRGTREEAAVGSINQDNVGQVFSPAPNS